MTRWGIPYYRLPAEMLDRDVSVIEATGVTLRYNTRIGIDISMDDLRTQHDAVLLAVGLQMGRSTRIPGSDHPDVRRAVDLLRDIASGTFDEVPRSAVVIGGGNVAMDIARSMARHQRQAFGTARITLVALEDRSHFLADADEIEESEEEGITILDARGPREILLEDGRISGLRTWHVKSIFDDQGRFAPSYDETDEQVHAGEMIIEAIGQMADVSLLGDALTEQLAWQRGRLQVDARGQTSEPWLWAAGDLVRGPDVVSAVADGHRVATGIDTFVQQTAPARRGS
jgi:glutamate synthase (NADPH/NADH) small chain